MASVSSLSGLTLDVGTPILTAVPDAYEYKFVGASAASVLITATLNHPAAAALLIDGQAAASGGAILSYSMDGGLSWTLYSGDLVVNSDGVHSIRFKAVDAAGMKRSNSARCHTAILRERQQDWIAGVYKRKFDGLERSPTRSVEHA